MFGLVPWWVNLGAGAAAVLGLLLLGDTYGFHAHRLAKLEAANQARNDAVDYQAEHDEVSLQKKDADLAAAGAEFNALTRGDPGCPLTLPQATAVNVVKE